MSGVCQYCISRDCEKKGDGKPCGLVEKMASAVESGLKEKLFLSKNLSNKYDDAISTVQDLIDSDTAKQQLLELYENGDVPDLLGQKELEEMLDRYEIFMPKPSEQMFRIMFSLFIHGAELDDIACFYGTSGQNISGKFKTRVKKLVKRVKNDKQSRYASMFPSNLENPDDFREFFRINILTEPSSAAPPFFFQHSKKADRNKGSKLGRKRGRPRKK